MRLGFAFLAEAATASDADGLFSALRGGIDAFEASKYPAIWHTVFLVARVIFSATEHNQEQYGRAEFITPTGEAVPDADTTFIVRPRPDARHPDRDTWMTLCIGFQDLRFMTTGEYNFRISFGGQTIGQVALIARERA